MNKLELKFLKEYEDFEIVRQKDIKITIFDLFKYNETKAKIIIFSKNINVENGNYDEIQIGTYRFTKLSYGIVKEKNDNIVIELKGCELIE